MKLFVALRRYWMTILGLLLMVIIPVIIIHRHGERELHKLVWKEWYPGVLEVARQKREITWITFHSDWDVTNQVNIMRVLKDEKATAVLRRNRVQLVKKDCTRWEKEVEVEIQRYRQDYLPLNMVVPKDPKQPLIKMPELFGPDELIRALEQAAGK